MATLRELAERTGYSVATISRILSGDPSLSVTEEARHKVLEEAGRLNYTANRSRRGRTPKGVLRIGLAEMLTPAQQLEDPYYLYLSSFVRQVCMEKKYTLVPLERWRGGFRAPAGEEKLDGILAIGLFSQEQIADLEGISPILVFLDSSPKESCHDSVVVNYSLGISLALEHLQKLGHTKIGFLGPIWKLDDLHRRAQEVRRQLFCQHMEKLGLLQKQWLLDCPMETEAAAEAMQFFLESQQERPTAFLTANEEAAIGAIRTLQKYGISVPEQISVLSFNDTPRSALVEPPLTSVSTHVEDMSRTALRLLRERVPLPNRQAERVLPLKVVVPPSLTCRCTTAPPAIFT